MKIHELFNLRPTHLDKDIGIEIEVEGRGLGFALPTGWKAEVDHSLRGESMEYVLRQPQKLNKGLSLVDSLQSTMAESGARVDDSIRAGVHIHLNAKNNTPMQVLNFITAYLVFEKVLMKYCGESREYNAFCLSSEDAEYFTYKLMKSIENKDLMELDTEHLRYGALNPTSLFTYGSLEFRAMRTPQDFKYIKVWATALYNIRKMAYACDNPTAVMEYMNEFGLVFGAKEILGGVFDYFDNDDITEQLQDGFKNAYTIASADDWTHQYWSGDVEPSGQQEIPAVISGDVFEDPTPEPPTESLETPTRNMGVTERAIMNAARERRRQVQEAQRYLEWETVVRQTINPFDWAEHPTLSDEPEEDV